MHIVLVHVHVKPDCVDRFEIATVDNATSSRLEPGVVRFDVLRQHDDSTRYVLVEIYRHADDALTHKTTPHYLRWRDTVAPFMAEARVGLSCSNVSPTDSEW
jgi:autoinducer 2-degrading protein